MKGVKDYQPTYPNFPKQVMDASEAELYLNAIVQYFHDWVADVTGDLSISWKPHYDKEARSKLKDQVTLTVVAACEVTATWYQALLAVPV